LYKKLGFLLLSIIFVFLIGSQKLYAYESHNVKDYLNYLTEKEVNNLQRSIDKIKEKHDLELVIVITDDTEGKSSMEFADDYYDYNGYGVGDDHSGLLLLIDMNARVAWISTTGSAIVFFDNSKIDEILDKVTPYLTDGRYYNASKAFVNFVRSDLSYFYRALSMLFSLQSILIAIVISLIVTIILSISSKGKVTVDSRTYEEAGGFKLDVVKDQFIRETTTRVKIETSSSSGGGGGGGTHIGSSGRSHGGGGRSF